MSGVHSEMAWHSFVQSGQSLTLALLLALIPSDSLLYDLRAARLQLRNDIDAVITVLTPALKS